MDKSADPQWSIFSVDSRPVSVPVDAHDDVFMTTSRAKAPPSRPQSEDPSASAATGN